MFGIDLPRGQISGRVVDELVPEAIAPECHRHVLEPETPPDDRVRDRRCRLEGLVRDLLHGHQLSAPKRPVGRDQRFGLRIGEPRGDRRSGEAGEDRHLNGAQVRAGVRGDRDLRRHRQVDPDRIALADADRREPFGEAEDLVGKLAPGQRETSAVLALPDRGLLLGELARGPLVDAVPGEIQLAAREPGGPLAAARRVHDPLPGLRELEAEILDHGRPEALRLLDRDAV